MSKDIAFDNETRTKMAAGVNKLADAVRVTIGPKGRYVAMQKEHEKPNVFQRRRHGGRQCRS